MMEGLQKNQIFPELAVRLGTSPLPRSLSGDRRLLLRQLNPALSLCTDT